jgi:hypothetical protein
MTAKPTAGRSPSARRIRPWVSRRVLLAFAVGIAATSIGAESHALPTLIFSVLMGFLVAVPLAVLGRRGEPEPDDDATEAPSDDVDWPLPAPRPPQPTRMRNFRGRDAELARLIRSHNDERSARQTGDAAETKGPVILTIHGMPGVGKTALAREVARQLSDQYKDGIVLVNFGTGGSRRPEAELLRILLRRAGWSEADVNRDIPDLGSLMRSVTTGRQFIFIFDAARDQQQVQRALINEPGCAVIITSRRDISWALNVPERCTLALDVPSPEEALDMLGAVGRVDWLGDADTAIEMVELCERLPFAITAAAERMADEGTPLRNVVALLRSPSERLARLAPPGRDVLEGIETEYRRLSPVQKDALALLSLVRSRTFIPWVLMPLLGLERHHAESTMVALGAAQLLRQAGSEVTTGLPRYEYNPLVRLFAEKQLAALHPGRPGWVANAQRHLDEAYYQFSRDVLDATGEFARAIANHPEPGIRFEYGNLVRGVAVAADRSDHSTCWQVAARLRGCVPKGADRKASLAAFDLGELAAILHSDPIGSLDVALARAGLLIAVEDYRAARCKLVAIYREARQLLDSPYAKGARLQAARVFRSLAEAYLQMGAYGKARTRLADARHLLDGLDDDHGERRLLRLLEAETERTSAHDADLSDPGRTSLDDSATFRALLDRAESARRRRLWIDARHYLEEALAHSAGDARRTASVYYRLARLYVDQRQTPIESNAGDYQSQDKASDLNRRAVSYAAQAVLAFQWMGNEVGEIRAQCLHVRALVVAGKLMEAERLCYSVMWRLKAQDNQQPAARRALEARFCRARGEWQLQDDGTVPSARRALKHAAMIYEELEDWSSRDEVWRVLRQLTIPHDHAAGPTAVADLDRLLDSVVSPDMRLADELDDDEFGSLPTARG